MDDGWNKRIMDIVAQVAKVAPMLGTILGGPVGGAAGTAFNMIASALGVKSEPNVDSSIEISEKLATDPQALIKIREIEANNQLELQKVLLAQEVLLAAEETKQIAEDTNRIEAVNATMQVEGKSEHWPQYSWRPFWGFVSALSFFAVCVFVCCLAYQAIVLKDMNAMVMIPQLITSMTMLFGIPGAILGVSAWYRGKTKLESAKALPEIKNVP